MSRPRGHARPRGGSRRCCRRAAWRRVPPSAARRGAGSCSGSGRRPDRPARSPRARRRPAIRARRAASDPQAHVRRRRCAGSPTRGCRVRSPSPGESHNLRNRASHFGVETRHSHQISVRLATVDGPRGGSILHFVPDPEPVPAPASEPHPEPVSSPQPLSAPQPVPALQPLSALQPPPDLAAPPPPPPPPAWTRTYELPSARRVVSSGLQLALASTRALRRASIYIGLLSLGAFGPAVVLLLLGVGRLLSDPRTAEIISTDPSLLFYEQPELAGPLALIYILFLVGVVLLVAISIDAQAIAISLLAGTASERPVRLWEAIIRARQVFWRLLGAGSLLWVMSAVVTLVVMLPFIRPFQSNQGLNFIATMVATLVLTPFAFVSAGIVLGDVGPIEALQRSTRLFRARPRIALVVTLFTLVTSAIQAFALGAGLDLAIRVAEFLHLGLDQGPGGLILPAILVLAFIVAFGSLSFTIAAIVAAPQVAGFLGLTFYTGGLDRARTGTETKPKGVRWVTLPMVVSIVGLAGVAVLALPGLMCFEPRGSSPARGPPRSAAKPHEQLVSAFGEPVWVEDAAGDHGAGAASSADILAADLAYLPRVPDWLLDDVFACGAAQVACGDDDPTNPASFERGAYLFVQRMAAAPPQVAGGGHYEWGPVLRMTGGEQAPTRADARFSAASDIFRTELDDERLEIRWYGYEDGAWNWYYTSARSAWRGDLLVTIVPSESLSDPTAWDAYRSEEHTSELQSLRHLVCRL